jgi:hypothetical protein
MDDVDIAHTLQERLCCKTGHVCDSRCKISNPLATVVQRGSTQVVLWQWDRPLVGDTKVRTLSNVYVCEGSRSVHLCTADCTVPKILNAEHCLICPVSGLQWNGETEQTRSWRNVSKCLPTIGTIKSDPNRFCRDNNGVVIEGSMNLTVQLCKQQVKTLLQLMLFSQVRKQSEFAKYLDGVSNANKNMNKYMRYSVFHQLPKNVATMATIYTNTVFAEPNFFRTMHQYKCDRLCAEYAPLLVAYWHCLLPNTVFTTFLPACLYLMRSGVHVEGLRIIQRSNELERILPEANTLDLYNINKPCFTQTKNMILAKIREVDPVELLHTITKCTQDNKLLFVFFALIFHMAQFPQLPLAWYAVTRSCGVQSSPPHFGWLQALWAVSEY